MESTQIDPYSRLMAMQVTDEESPTGVILFETRSCDSIVKNTRFSGFGILPEKPEKDTAALYNSARVKTKRDTIRTGEITDER